MYSKAPSVTLGEAGALDRGPSESDFKQADDGSLSP